MFGTPHRPNDCRLEVAIETAAAAEQRESGLSWSAMRKLCHTADRDTGRGRDEDLYG